MHDAHQLRSLINEYGQLETLSGAHRTPQARGVRFNELIAEMLGCWGIDAEVSASTTKVGEIDVTFTLGDDRYLIEAKWEKDKTDIGPLAKLEKRLTQRLRGTTGIFLAVAGFTSEALQGVNIGSQPGMLLLDRSHFEAMLSGFVPPQELLKLAHDRAAFRGEVYSSIVDLLAPKQKVPPVSYGCPPSLDNILLESVTGVNAQVLFTMTNSNQLGVCSVAPAKVLTTHQEGIAEVDLKSEKATWKVPIRGCHRKPISTSDGSVICARQHGIGRFRNGQLTIIGGAISESSSLFTAPDGGVWAVDSWPIDTPPSSGVTKLGDRLGQQERHEISTIWKPVAVDGAWLDSDRLACIHNNYCSVSSLNGVVAQGIATGMSNCAAILSMDERTVLSAGGSAELSLTDLVTGRHASLAKLALRPSVFELAAGPGNTIYLASYFGPTAMDFAVVQIDTGSPASEFAMQAFSENDTGDLSGYAEQIQRIASRKVPLSTTVEPQLNALYNQAIALVDDRLCKSILKLFADAGLHLLQQDVPRILDGWPPPHYGGGASQPRWRLPNRDDAWLEASIGVSHRVWPSDNLNDLIVTLIIAEMSERAQRTLLTRFVPFELQDPTLPSKIDAILADVEAIYPARLSSTSERQ